MKIAIDIDEVCDNLMEVALNVYNDRHNTSYTINDCTHFKLADNFSDEMANELYDIFNEPNTIDSMTPNKDAVWTVSELMLRGHQVFFATATDPKSLENKINWLSRHFTINSRQVISIYHKELLNVDVLIDDNIDNLKAGIYDRICYDQPWNRNVRDDVYGINRVKSWREIIDIIKQFEREQE